MIQIDYPAPHFQIKEENNKPYIFDALRKTWLLLTEEEWVRQNFVQYIIKVLQYPAALIAIEKALTLNGLKKRFDILVYNQQHQPWMLVECKAPHIALSEDVLQQALRYNISAPAEYLIITNGNSTLGWKKEKHSLQLLEQMPPWP